MTTTRRAAQNFTRQPGKMAEPTPPGADGPLDYQLKYQPCTARRVGAWGFSVPVTLRRSAGQSDEWVVPARECHEGDRIELGPLPDGVKVTYAPLHRVPEYAPRLIDFERAIG